ncbi:MAG TPA: porin [Thermomonas sp.]|nr:porin [Thermomonas sp.]
MLAHPLLRLSMLAACCVASPLRAAEPVRLSGEWDLRLRHEQVADDAFASKADASTLRLRAGLRLSMDKGWTGLLEAEGIAAAGDYNSGANGRTGYPAIIDPPGVELNQAWLGWKGARGGGTLGRQRLLFDNQRWIGNVGWRQNEQTFDALALDIAPREDLALRYAFLDRVHRVNGDDALDPRNRERALSSHLFNAAWKHARQQLVGYGYLHEDRDVASASSATWGMRWTGTHALAAATLGWTLEAAHQRDHADNPLRFSHDYWLVEPSIAAGGITARAGWEHLGGDGVHALQSPLATLHAFNGWADKFLVTPPAGLEDRYLDLSGSVGRERAGTRTRWQVAWHDYRADRGGARYGREWNASLSLPLAKGLGALLKVADYRAAGFARDTRKLWLQLEYKGSR